VKGKMKNESKNRPRTLKTTPKGEPRPPRHRKTQHNKHNDMDEKRSLRTNNNQKRRKRTETLRTKLQRSQTRRSKTIHSQQRRIKRKKRKPDRILQHRNPILRADMEQALLPASR
jgi:hypothetical protein